MALRLARAYTGKNKVIKFAYHFHGWHDYLILGEPRGVGGVPDKVAETVVVLEPNLLILARLFMIMVLWAVQLLEEMLLHYSRGMRV